MGHITNLHCPKCNHVIAVTHTRLDTPKVRAEIERAALEAHRCSRYEPEEETEEP